MERAGFDADVAALRRWPLCLPHRGGRIAAHQGQPGEIRSDGERGADGEGGAGRQPRLARPQAADLSLLGGADSLPRLALYSRPRPTRLPGTDSRKTAVSQDIRGVFFAADFADERGLLAL